MGREAVSHSRCPQVAADVIRGQVGLQEMGRRLLELPSALMEI